MYASISVDQASQARPCAVACNLTTRKHMEAVVVDPLIAPPPDAKAPPAVAAVGRQRQQTGLDFPITRRQGPS